MLNAMAQKAYGNLKLHFEMWDFTALVGLEIILVVDIVILKFTWAVVTTCEIHRP